jgi:NADH-quinone oxidoreductase subunit J
MTPEQIFFLLVGVLTLVSAVMVVSTRNLVHAALWLVATLFGIAMIYALLSAPFLAVVQVVVYIGAIAILFIFAVMLTRRDQRDDGQQHNSNWGTAFFFAALTFAGLFLLLRGWSGFNNANPEAVVGDPLQALSLALVSPDAYVLPFEVASIMLLAALVGAVYAAYKK